MVASGSGMGVVGVTGGIEGKMDVMDKTMEGLSLSEASDLLNSVGTGSQGKDKEEEMDISKSLLFETLHRLLEEELYIFVDLIKKKDMKEKKELR